MNKTHACVARRRFLGHQGKFVTKEAKLQRAKTEFQNERRI
jgi:hypothetical protein